MTASLSERKKLYELYVFDAPYDLEPKGPVESLLDYAEVDLAGEPPAKARAEDDENELKGLNLTLEDAGRNQPFPASERDVLPIDSQVSGRRVASSPVLGLTLSRRKKFLKKRIEELVADTGARNSMVLSLQQ